MYQSGPTSVNTASCDDFSSKPPEYLKTFSSDVTTAVDALSVHADPVLVLGLAGR
jgi:hypothetical protein